MESWTILRFHNKRELGSQLKAGLVLLVGNVEVEQDSKIIAKIITKTPDYGIIVQKVQKQIPGSPSMCR